VVRGDPELARRRRPSVIVRAHGLVPIWWPSLRRAQQPSSMARSATVGVSLTVASTAGHLGPTIGTKSSPLGQHDARELVGKELVIDVEPVRSQGCILCELAEVDGDWRRLLPLLTYAGARGLATRKPGGAVLSSSSNRFANRPVLPRESTAGTAKVWRTASR